MDLTLRIILAAVLVWAALAKLRDARGLVRAVGDHGVPAPLRTPVAVLLPVAEVALAALLLIPATARIAGWGVAVLGVVFAASLGAMRLRGRRRAPCGCFGGTRERPVGFLVARALLLAAAGALVGAGVVPSGWPSQEVMVGVALGVLALAVVVLTVLVLALYRQVGVLEGRLGPRAALELAEEGPPVGRAAPALEELRGRGSELVAFASPGCRLCAALEPALDAIARDGIDVHRVDEAARPGDFAAWRVPGTPFAVHVIDGVVVAKGLVNTLEQIEELIALGEGRLGAVA
ncbi:MAG: MauE/DoxX family redox-associated membrane protein [Thermoleophilia bacterium]